MHCNYTQLCSLPNSGLMVLHLLGFHMSIDSIIRLCFLTEFVLCRNITILLYQYSPSVKGTVQSHPHAWAVSFSQFKICTALIKEKDIGFIRAFCDDVDDKDDDLITPYTYQEIPFPSVSTTPEQPPVEACVPICAILSKKSEKYPPQGIQGLNRRFQRKCFSNCEMPTLCSKFALH